MYVSYLYNLIFSLKAHTHTPTFGGSALESALESADSSPELANSTTDFVIVGRPPVLNMFNISTRSSWPTLVCRLLISLGVWA